MNVAKRKSIRTIIHILKQKGYKLFERPYELNIVGIRNDSTAPNKFDDTIYVFWKNDSGKWEGKYYNATTDPGTYYLLNPLSNLGAALLKEGQYVDAYQIGLHKGQYEALVQKKNVTVYRDYDRDAILDFNNGREETGMFGINIHRAGSSGTTVEVDNWSAGCQVLENADSFRELMDLAKKHVSLYGNSLTYTLIDERAYNRALKRWMMYAALGILAVTSIYIGYRTYQNKPLWPIF